MDIKTPKTMKIRCNSKSFKFFEMDLFGNVYHEKPNIDGYEIYEVDTNINHEYVFEEIDGKWYVKTR